MNKDDTGNKAILIFLFAFLVCLIIWCHAEAALIATFREWASGVLGALLMLMRVSSKSSGVRISDSQNIRMLDGSKAEQK